MLDPTAAPFVPRRIEEPTRTPWLEVVFGYGPMLPTLGAGLLIWVWRDAAVAIAWLGVLWTAAIVIFIAGVRRGLSFRTEGGERTPQLRDMLLLFCAGFAALLMPLLPALAILLLAWVAIAVLDRAAARRSEAPPYFARLRPIQAVIAGAGLMLLLARVAWGAP